MSESSDAALLRKARDEYSVKLQPVRVQRLEADITWVESFTKLLAFNQTQYHRVVVLDSDANVLQVDTVPHALFSTVAMPRAYWLDNTLSSQLIVIQPSEQEFGRIEDAFSHRNTSDFDMEILNDLYGKECLILPHRYYDLITGEFRNNFHHRYLDSGTEHWNARRALRDAKYLHFSDWPYPKPWSEYSHYTHDKLQPPCQMTVLGEEDCSTRDVWNEIYFEFLDRRQGLRLEVYA
ncbi:unnamed protein product [Aureobasidium mustum]|uniref:Nucleotide-diphospho-sugar transferase n=1 Tax=Aureobasidium mustum TaxID=2773714 RepID=A0A9N8PIK6_9PEZI|nr:unnamed protein product [Aureobasidium mustum]